MKISSDKKRLIEEVCNRHNLHLAILYGSKAKNMHNQFSDTDIAVKAENVLDSETLLKLESEFDRIFEKCEVVDIRTSPVLLLANIAQDGILLYESKPDLFYEFKIFAINHYIEYKPYFEKQSKLLKERISKY